MASTQSVHGRITYRRAAAVIDAKIEDLNYVKQKNNHMPELCEILQYAIVTLQDVREDLRERNTTHYWPLPL